MSTDDMQGNAWRWAALREALQTRNFADLDTATDADLIAVEAAQVRQQAAAARVAQAKRRGAQQTARDFSEPTRTAEVIDLRPDAAGGAF
jgi:hypothetical protein